MIKRLTFLALILVSSLCYAKDAYVLSIKGAIGPATADYIERGIGSAQQKGSLIVITIDTPGGLDKSTRQIVKAILASKIPVISLVTPKGARAASAGTYILYASQIASMSEGTHLGAASPVNLMGGNGKDTTMQKKVSNDAIAYIKSLAQLRNRNIDFAINAVKNAATLTANEALKQNVINLIANDIDELLNKIRGKTVNGIPFGNQPLNIKVIQPDWRTELLSLIASPTAAYLLILLAIYGLFFELSNPGGLLPGVVGAIALVLALYALQFLPISFAGLALLILGIAFMIAEAFVPSFGALGFGGVIAFIIGSVLLFDTNNQAFQIAKSLIIGVAIVNAAFFILVSRMVLVSRFQQPLNSLSSLIGESAVTLKAINGKGQVKVKGEIWQAVSDTPIDKGQEVTIIDTKGLLLKVKPKE